MHIKADTVLTTIFMFQEMKSSQNMSEHPIISQVLMIKEKIMDINRFFNAYNEVVHNDIPALNAFIERYVQDRISNVKTEVVDRILTSIKWDDMRVNLTSSVKNNRPVDDRKLLWVDVNGVSDMDIEPFDDTDIICMYDNYDENTLKVFYRHSKSFGKYVSSFIEDVKEFDEDVNVWAERCYTLMVNENLGALIEHHYKFVVDAMKDLKLTKRCSKKSKDGDVKRKHKDDSVKVKDEGGGKPVASDVKVLNPTVMLNGINVRLIQSQQEFIKTAVKDIVGGL